jgi:hypothetical protein
MLDLQYLRTQTLHTFFFIFRNDISLTLNSWGFARRSIIRDVFFLFRKRRTYAQKQKYNVLKLGLQISFITYISEYKGRHTWNIFFSGPTTKKTTFLMCVFPYGGLRRKKKLFSLCSVTYSWIAGYLHIENAPQWLDHPTIIGS